MVHLLQKSCDNFCCSLNSLVKAVLVVGSGPEGMVMSPSPTRKCAGVKCSASSPREIGLEFTAASMLTRVVLSCSSVSHDWPNTFRRHRLTMPTILSHHPPHQAARGAMNFQVMPSLERNRWVSGDDIAFQSSNSSALVA